VLGFDPESRQAALVSIHPGILTQDVVENTGFPLQIPQDLPETALPTPEELRLLREEIDPNRVYLR